LIWQSTILLANLDVFILWRASLQQCMPTWLNRLSTNAGAAFMAVGYPCKIHLAGVSHHGRENWQNDFEHSRLRKLSEHAFQGLIVARENAHLPNQSVFKNPFHSRGSRGGEAQTEG
jgi:hypothetical protein